MEATDFLSQPLKGKAETRRHYMLTALVVVIDNTELNRSALGLQKSVQNASQYAAGSHAITYRMLVLPFSSWFHFIYIDQVRASWK